MLILIGRDWPGYQHPRPVPPPPSITEVIARDMLFRELGLGGYFDTVSPFKTRRLS